MTRFVASLIMLVAVAVAVEGSGCRVVTVRAAAVHHAPYVAPVAYYQPVATYSIGYNGSGELAEAVRLLIEANKEERQENRLMQERLIQALTTGGAGPMPLKSHVSDPGYIHLRRDCAKCHDESVSKAKGKGYTFFRAGEFLDEGDNLSLVMDAIKAGRMPKDQKWDFQKKYEASTFLTLKPAEPEKLESKEAKKPKGYE